MGEIGYGGGAPFRGDPRPGFLRTIAQGGKEDLCNEPVQGRRTIRKGARRSRWSREDEGTSDIAVREVGRSRVGAFP